LKVITNLPTTQGVPPAPTLTGEKLGGVRLEQNKHPASSRIDYAQLRDADIPMPPSTKCHEITVENEYDPEEIKAKIKSRTILMCPPGCGKSHAAISVYALPTFGVDKILVVTPYNAQARNIRREYMQRLKVKVQAITYHRWAGESIDGTQNKKKKPYDMTGVKCVVFDEIMLLQYEKLIKIWKFMAGHPDITYIATGDPHQLPAINDTITPDKKAQILVHEEMFPTVIKLKINKRIREDQRELLREIEQAIWSCQKHKDMQQLVWKYFGKNVLGCLNDLNSTGIQRALSYFKTSSRTLNRHIHNYANVMTSTSTVLADGLRYHEGDILICKGGFYLQEVNSALKTGLYPNYTYMIKQIDNDHMILVDVLTDEQFNVTHDRIMNNFSLQYRNTVHSAQGDTIKGKFVIADLFSQHEGISKEWLYTAVTRAADLDDIHFLAQSLYNENMHENAMEMVRRYKEQDRKAGRAVIDNVYIPHLG
jgi:hypothetical protein